MIVAFAVLFACQLLGELLARALNLPLPGPVLGMGLLFLFLLLRGGQNPRQGPGAVPAPLAAAADGLLGHLSILFVPAAVGVMRYFELLRANVLTIAAAVAVSTVLAMAATAATFRLLSPSADAPKKP